MKSHFVSAALVVAGFAAATTAVAQDRTQLQEQQRLEEQSQQQIRDREIYGSQLMTRQERDQYRQKMRAAATEQEREQIRLEHHARMRDRAKERGVTLPDQPPATGAGRGMGPGGGAGFGPGGSGGPGGGRGR